MFLQFLDRGRATVPNFEGGRLVWQWFAGHRIPTVAPSFETHTTRPILLHSGHFAWSPTSIMFLFPPSFYYLHKFFQTSFLTWKWVAQMIYRFDILLIIPLVMYTISFTRDCLI